MRGVILIAATNRPDVLDPALLRPGRFDRQVVVPVPDLGGREGILKVHLKKKLVADNLDISVLARGTPGFTGADLENMVNEAALMAARRGKDRVEMDDFEDAKDKVLMGTERKSMIISERREKTYRLSRVGAYPDSQVTSRHRSNSQGHHYPSRPRSRSHPAAPHQRKTHLPEGAPLE